MFLFSCTKEKDSITVSWENNYYPIQIGYWISYQIKEIIIDKESAVNDTSDYQIKNIIADCIEETENYKSYRVETYIRNSEKNKWQHYKNWELKHYAVSIHTIKENMEKIVLLNPVKKKDKWNGNAYNTDDEMQYELKEIKDSLINGTTKKIAQVEHSNQSNLIEKIYEFDEFAENIGLVKSVDINVQLNIDPDKTWEEKVTKGTIVYQTFLAYGNE